VHYWASPIEAKLCSGQEVALVGAGNSAGQAVVYLAGQVSKLWLLVRGPGLEASMSRYLIDRIAALPNVELHTGTEVIGLEGEVITTNDVALFEYKEEDVHGRISGTYRSTNAVPKFKSRLVYYGLDRAWAEAMRQI